MKLAAELARPETGRTLYIFDEPTTGLHFADVDQLLDVFRQLTALGNTVLVIEHNLDMLAAADWIVDMGPEGGAAGGEIVAEGTPAEIMSDPRSVTRPFLRAMLEGREGRAEEAAEMKRSASRKAAVGANRSESAKK